VDLEVDLVGVDGEPGCWGGVKKSCVSRWDGV
jgi:hypothetical protein